MNDDPSYASKPNDIADTRTHTSPTEHALPVEKGASPPVSIPSAAAAQTNGNIVNGSNGDASNEKSDSEAETVVLSGKEEAQEHKMKKAIKLEETSGAQPEVHDSPETLPTIVEDQRESSKDISSRRSSLKRKRSTHELGTGDVPDGGISSNLSSTISSPVQAAHSSKTTDTDSDRSRSSPPFEEVAHQHERKVNKQRTRNGNGQIEHQRGKSDRGTDVVNGRKRRDTRSATHYDESNHRSKSPPSRHEHRTLATQSNLPNSGVTKRRKTPAALHVERRRKASEDTHPDSDDSSSVHSHNHLHKLASTDNNAMSPAKMVTHKKQKDRNGRTWLARACAQGAAEAEKWLKERPGDIDIPDNAGNTPLQIAALEGDTEVVQLLLDAGCRTDCKNIDKDTPLIDAVENGHLEVVKILLKAGLDPRVGNANGSKPLELVRDDDEEADEIRAALVACEKDKELLRRPSEDHNRQHSTEFRDVEMSGMGTSATSPVNGGRSPPPPGPGARRRTARSQPTDDALLWVNATPGRLRDACGKGDLTIVDHILKMRPKADTESVLAAARGGHDVVLQLLLAIGDVDPDPEPLRSGDSKSGYNTPMLAAIGRGNIIVIKLLLGQPGFNPTRRLFKGMSYPEIAKERQGSEWEEEYDVLKNAYENHKQPGGRKSNSSSPRKVRAKRADSTKSSEPSSSPHEARKARRTLLKEESPDTARRDPYRESALKHAKETRRQASSANTSDHEPELLGPPKAKSKDGDSYSSKRADSLKPKRRLMTGNEFKSDQDTKRRASLATEASDLPRRKSGDSISSHDGRRRRLSDVSETTLRIRSEEPLQIKGEPGKKRHRMSVSPQASKSNLVASADSVKKKKRQRVDSQGGAVDQDRDRTFRPGPPMVANMIASPVKLTSPPLPPAPPQPQGTAPVAFMGSTVASPVTKSPPEPNPHSALVSPVNSIEQTLQPPKDPDDLQAQKQVEDDIHRQERLEQECERQVVKVEEERLARMEVEKQEQADAERERQAKAEREEAERKARVAQEVEEARLEAQRQAEEAERQIQQEREEEEVRVAKKKREEDLQKRRIEQEKHRKEEQERRRREQEERESIRRIRMQEEEERQRRASLPNGLRRAAELSPDEARTAKEITKWLPLRTVTTQELHPDSESQIAEEQWIANIQVAPILAIQDLELSQYTAWTRFPATINHRGSLWRQLRNPMSQSVPLALLSPAEVFNLDEETRPKFFSLRHIFWIKLSDFMDIVPRHPHLAGLKLKTRAMVLHEFPFGRGGTVERPGGGDGTVKQEATNPVMNGNMTNGYR
ncbi:hypothetical protein N7G274_004174 [Stereocaulon virgatum]|uniref:Uncharacterized protein n=1 Tax=Stereocaulon virgatum TaxID=373712 RepID=A0ABR4AEG6_9LECA